MNLLFAAAPVVHHPLPLFVVGIVAVAVAGATVAAVRSGSTTTLLCRGIAVLTGALRWSAAGACVALLVTGGLSAYGTKTDQWRNVPILSGSMSPALDEGDVAIVRPTTAEDTSVGDVIVFNAPRTSGAVREGTPVIHRVVEIVDPTELADTEPGGVYVRTQGDANEQPDMWTVKLDSDVVWRQSDTVRDVGGAFTLVARPSSRSALLAGAAILLAGAATAQWIGSGRSEPDSTVVTSQ